MNSQNTRSFLPRIRRAILLTIIALAFSIAISGLSKVTRAENPIDRILRISIVDTDGRPVNGAQIFKNGLPLATTDSFGEWKGIVPVRPSETMHFQARKSIDHKIFSAERSLNVNDNTTPLSLGFTIATQPMNSKSLH